MSSKIVSCVLGIVHVEKQLILLGSTLKEALPIWNRMVWPIALGIIGIMSRSRKGSSTICVSSYTRVAAMSYHHTIHAA